MALLQTGENAPGFRLKNQDNQLISLDQFKGKWVVTYFYPKALTSGCTVQACGIRDAGTAWKKLNCVVLGISPDKPELLKKFQTVEHLPFDLLSDLDHSTAEAYGVWQQKSMYGRTYMGMARTTYIIDPNGKVAHVFEKVKPAEHAAQVEAWLKEHQ